MSENSEAIAPLSAIKVLSDELQDTPPTPGSLTHFKKDLKALLKKHNATLFPVVEGDTHGIHDERIEVSFSFPKKQGDRFRRNTDGERINQEEELSPRNI